MKTLLTIKKDLEFNNNLSSLIEVLKNIAVSQFRALEQKIITYKNFFEVIEIFFEFMDIPSIRHSFLNPENKSQMIIAVTSDTGLLGGLNMQIIATAVRELEGIPGKFIVIGERGKIYARESGIPFVAFGGIKDAERYSQAMQLRDYAINKIIENSIGYLKIVYPIPVSFTVQRVETICLLPYAPVCLQQAKLKETPLDVIFESDINDIVEYLIYLWIGQKIYEVFGLSRLAEFAARFVHLEASLQKLKGVDGKLRLQYFRFRHELIDRNMRELFSARLLYAR